MTTETTTDRPSVEEMTQSLTGFDEIAIEKHMGMDIYTDGETKPVMLLRSLVMVHKTRDGLSGPDARAAALGMKVSEVQDYFTESETALPDTEPETEAGKESSDSETQPSA